VGRRQILDLHYFQGIARVAISFWHVLAFGVRPTFYVSLFARRISLIKPNAFIRAILRMQTPNGQTFKLFRACARAHGGEG
jgi:hypothetical protein